MTFSRSVKTFSNKGDNVLKDLQHLGKGYAREAEDMAALIKAAKASWSDEAIRYRDELVHFGQLRDFRCLIFAVVRSNQILPRPSSRLSHAE